MAYYVINGGKRLEGSVTISGAKNAALAIIPACILAGESCRLENLPRIEDVHVLEQILRMMGAGVEFTPDGGMRIDPKTISTRHVTFAHRIICWARCWGATAMQRLHCRAAAK